ncbi:MAG: energy transducer TonB [Bacteroidota bacterium]
MKTMNYSWLGFLIPVLTVSLCLFFAGCNEEAKVDSKEAYQPKMEEHQMVEEIPVPTNLLEIRKEIGYPKTARESGIEGKVILRIKVDKEGSYSEHKVLVSDHILLQEAVEAQLPKLTFEPAKDKGVAVPFWVNIPFSFKLLD